MQVFATMVLCLLLVSTAFAANTHSSAAGDIYKEVAARAGDAQGAFLVSGGMSTTSANLVLPAFATAGYASSGMYAEQAAASVNLATAGAAATDICWVALHSSTSATVAGWTRQVGTHYVMRCDSDTQPAPTADILLLFRATVTASAVTAVAPFALRTPIPGTYSALDFGMSPFATAAENSAGFNLANATISNRGGGVLHIPGGTYNLDSNIEVPDRVIVQGDRGATVFSCSTSACRITFGKVAGGPGQAFQHGNSGNIAVNGNSLATACIVVRTVVQTHFTDLRAENCQGPGITLEGAQNNLFENFSSARNSPNLFITGQLANSTILHSQLNLPEALTPGGEAFNILISDGRGPSYFGSSEVRFLNFIGGIWEGAGDIATNGASMLVESGRDIAFQGIRLHTRVLPATPPVGHSLVRFQKTNVLYELDRISFRNIHFETGTSAGTDIAVEGVAGVEITTINLDFSNARIQADTGFSMAPNFSVSFSGPLETNTSTPFAATGGATIDSTITTRQQGLLRIFPAQAGGSALQTTSATTGLPIWQVSEQGVLGWRNPDGSGSITPGFQWSDNSTVKMGMPLKYTDPNAVTINGASGAGTAATINLNTVTSNVISITNGDTTILDRLVDPLKHLGQVVILVFPNTAATTVKSSGGNIRLNTGADFVSTQLDTLSLFCCTGASVNIWVETGRGVNN